MVLIPKKSLTIIFRAICGDGCSMSYSIKKAKESCDISLFKFVFDSYKV